MNINIDSHKFNIKQVKTPKKIQDGMMNKKFDDSFNGMLFFLDSGEHCFWMKNCVINLDIIFLKNNKITKIFHDCPPCKDNQKCKNYCGYGDMVLEIKGGDCRKLKIKEGNVLKKFNYY